MFSCLLLHSASLNEPIVAQISDVNVQVVGLVGRGKASATFALEREYKEAVLYVPSLISHRDASRQQVRVIDCRMQTLRDGESRTHSFQLTKLDPHEYSCRMQCLPDYASLKKRYKDLISAYCGAHSSDDILLHLGDLPSDCELSVHFEFLLRFTSSAAGPLQYVIQNRLPTQHLSYTLTLAAPLRIEDVLPTSAAPHQLNWDYLSKANPNIVQISCETTYSDTDVEPSPFSSGFTVKLASGIAAGCGCSLVSKALKSPNQTSWDGVMMLSGILSREQLPSSIQQRPFLPSEFVFVIDCSGSMSGTNIQAAADTLITCVKSLPEGCYFNVIAFGSSFRQLFYTSTEYSKKSVERAVQFANQLQASLGGTELLAPLRWIFKRPRCNGLPCQIFVITDGAVTNTQAVLHSVRKNRHQARCHTFGIGSEVCVELVTGIAAASGGKCVLLREGERLQTKVMEVLKESLQPAVSDTVLRWDPPEGYTVADSTPRNLGTLYGSNPYTAFALLKKTDGSESETALRHQTSSATIFGRAAGKDVEIPVEQTVLPTLTETQNHELFSILEMVAVWSKLCDLEMQALASSRKNSHTENEKNNQMEPPAKRPRLNGVNSSHSGSENGKQLDVEAREELMQLSMESGIPCALTYFCSIEDGETRVMQILPYQQNGNLTPKKALLENGAVFKYTAFQYQKHIEQLRRMYKKKKSYPHLRNRHHYPKLEVPPPPLSFSSLAKSSISAVGGTLKTVVNVATFGFFYQDSSNHLSEGGQSIDDEIAYLENRDSQLHWDDGKGQLVYPAFYYRSHPKNRSKIPSSDHGSKSKSRKTQLKSPAVEQTTNHMKHPESPSQGVSTETPVNKVIANGHLPDVKPELAADNSAGEEDDFTISDSESDSSVDPDWEDLRRPNELLPLIHMQLYSGAWPIVRAFSYAVGVPLEEIRKLPMKSDTEESRPQPAPPTSSESEVDNESKAHYWTTALAVACLEEYFESFQPEWELVAYKGRCWLESHLHMTGLSLPEVQRIARELVLRQS